MSSIMRWRRGELTCVEGAILCSCRKRGGLPCSQDRKTSRCASVLTTGVQPLPRERFSPWADNSPMPPGKFAHQLAGRFGFSNWCSGNFPRLLSELDERSVPLPGAPQHRKKSNAMELDPPSKGLTSTSPAMSGLTHCLTPQNPRGPVLSIGLKET